MRYKFFFIAFYSIFFFRKIMTLIFARYASFLFMGSCLLFFLICFEQNAWGARETTKKKEAKQIKLKKSAGTPLLKLKSKAESDVERGEASGGSVKGGVLKHAAGENTADSLVPGLQPDKYSCDSCISLLLDFRKPEYWHNAREAYRIFRSKIERRRSVLLECRTLISPSYESLSNEFSRNGFLRNNSQFLDSLGERFIMEFIKAYHTEASDNPFVERFVFILDSEINRFSNLIGNSTQLTEGSTQWSYKFKKECEILNSLQELNKVKNEVFSKPASGFFYDRKLSFGSCCESESSSNFSYGHEPSSDFSCDRKFRKAFLHLVQIEDEILDERFTALLDAILEEAIDSCNQLLSVPFSQRMSVLFNKRESLSSLSLMELLRAIWDTHDDYYAVPCWLMLVIGWGIDGVGRMAVGGYVPDSYEPEILKMVTGVISEPDRGFDCMVAMGTESVNKQEISTREDNILPFSGTIVDLEINHQYNWAFMFIPVCALVLDLPMAAIGFFADGINNYLFKSGHKLVFDKQDYRHEGIEESQPVLEAANKGQYTLDLVNMERNAALALEPLQIKSLEREFEQLRTPPKPVVVIYAPTLAYGVKQFCIDLFKALQHCDRTYFTRHANMHGTTVLYISGLCSVPHFLFIYIAERLLLGAHGEVLPNISAMNKSCTVWAGRTFGENVTLEEVHDDVINHHEHPEWEQAYLHEVHNVTGPLRGDDYNLVSLKMVILGMTIFNNGLYQGTQGLFHGVVVVVNKVYSGVRYSLSRCCHCIFRRNDSRPESDQASGN